MLEPIDQTLNSHCKEYFCYHIAAVIIQNLNCIDQRKCQCKKEGKAIIQTRKEREGSHKRQSQDGIPSAIESVLLSCTLLLRMESSKVMVNI